MKILKSIIVCIVLVVISLFSATDKNKNKNNNNISFYQLETQADAACEITCESEETYAGCITSIRNCQIYVYNPATGHYDLLDCTWVKKEEPQFIDCSA